MNLEELAYELSNYSKKELETYFNQENIDTLIQLKDYLDDLYYNTDQSFFSDYDYDILKETIIKRSPKYVPKVGAKIREGENRVKLPYYMGSLDKVKNNQELNKWLNKNKSNKYIIQKKLDGISALLTIQNGVYNLYTRGDGIIGADISYLIPYFTTIPKNVKENIVIRAELIIDKNVFYQKYSTTYKNPRNFVAGLISAKTVRDGLEDIEFIAYEIVSDNILTPHKQLLKLEKLGFQIVYYAIDDYHNITEPLLTDRLVYLKSVSSYEIDGLVIQPEKPYKRNTDGNPDYMIAFKPESIQDEKITTVINVEWQVSKHAFLKPVIIIEPVNVSGVTIKKVTAFNAKYVKDNNIGPGTIIKVVRSGEVIPKVISVIKQADKPQMPDVPYKWNETNVDILIELEEGDSYSETMCIKLIAGFFSKLGIKHVSEATVQKLYKHGYDSLLKIISAEKEDFEEIEGFGERLAERTYDNIHAGLQNVSIPLILGASSIFGFGLGEKKLVVLFESIPDLLTLYKKISKTQLYQKIMSVEGFSDKTTEKVVNNIEWADKFIVALSHFATFKKIQKEVISSKLQNQKIVMSGFRDKELQEKIEKLGGKVSTSVSGNTTMVIVKSKGEITGKIEKAQKLGIPIYTKQEFVEEFIE